MRGAEYFGDREILKDLLISEKHLSNSYNNCINESTGQSLGHILENILNETHTMHRDILYAMIKRGWFKIKNVSNKDIEMAKQRFQQLNEEL